MKNMIPVNEPVITEASKRYVADAMATGWVSSAGPYIDRFEKAFAVYLGRKHAVTVTNGTAALHLALAALGVEQGDEVIIPDFTMVACIDAILYCGATPVLCDVDPETFTIDPKDIERKITKRTKVIMPVHIYGHPADMDPILVLAQKMGIKVLEDSAEAHGAKYHGKFCGSLGDVSAFSFYGNKIITTGEGGMVVTDDDHLAERLRVLKDLAHSPQKRFWHEEVGFNYRMTNLQAALGLGQMESIEAFLDRKRSMAKRYEDGLRGIPGLRLPVTKPDCKNVFWMYAVLVEKENRLPKNAMREALKAEGIDTRDFFYPLHQMPIAKGCIGYGGPFPVAEDLAERGLYLPSGLAITDEQIDAVISAMQTVCKGK